jgi:hypothetical protein
MTKELEGWLFNTDVAIVNLIEVSYGFEIIFSALRTQSGQDARSPFA